MTNEFRTLDLECSSLVPQGPGYENITLDNQVCAVVGAVPGQTTVNGLRYLKLSFNYEQAHMWRVSNHKTLVPVLFLTHSYPGYWHIHRVRVRLLCGLPHHH